MGNVLNRVADPAEDLQLNVPFIGKQVIVPPFISQNAANAFLDILIPEGGPLTAEIIITGNEGANIIVAWGDGTKTQINLKGISNTVNHTYLLAGTYKVAFYGNLHDVTAIIVSQMLSANNFAAASFRGIGQLNITCCSLTEESVTAILAAYTDESKYPELTDLDLSGQTPFAPPNVQVYSAFKLARYLVDLITDPVPYNVKYIAPSDSYQTNPIATIKRNNSIPGFLTYWYDEGNIPQTIAIGLNSSFAYSGEGEIGLLRIWGNIENIRTLYITEDPAITEISVKGFIGLTDCYFGMNSLTNASIYALLQELYVENDFPDLSTVDLTSQSTGAGITQDQYDTLSALRPGVTLMVDIITL